MTCEALNDLAGIMWSTVSRKCSDHAEASKDEESSPNQAPYQLSGPEEFESLEEVPYYFLRTSFHCCSRSDMVFWSD